MKAAVLDKMVWFVDFGGGSQAAFAHTYDAARWIVANASHRSSTKAVHIATDVPAMLPAYVKVRKTVLRNRQEIDVHDRLGTKDADLRAVVDALRFVMPPMRVEEL